MTSKLHLGYAVGQDDVDGSVDIPVMHTSITGITRHGKSETMQALAERAAEQNYTVLLFDVKAKRDYGDIGTEVPIYIDEATNPTTVKGLLEATGDISMSFHYSELIKVHEPGDDYRGMLARVEEMMAEDRHPVEEDKLRVIEHLLGELVAELDDVEIADDVRLEPGAVNVMDLSGVGDAVQQLAIASTVERVLDDGEGVIIGIDEAHNFIPQNGSPPANAPIVKTIREGAASDVWVYLLDQTITGIDKDPLKQVGVWLLGKQREKNEAKRVLDQVPGSTGYTKDDVMTLEKGQFITALDGSQPLVYAQPRWMGSEEARAIAGGEETVEAVATPDEAEVRDIEEELAAKEQRLREVRETLAEREETIEDLRDRIDTLDALLDQRDDEADSTDDSLERDGLEQRGTASADPDEIRAIVEEYIEEYDVPSELRVEKTQPRIEVYHEVEPVEVSVDEDDPKGVIAYLYAQGELPTDRKLYSGQFEDLASEQGYNITLRRTGHLTDLCRMGLMEKDSSNKYGFRMPPTEAKERGLLVVEEAIA